MFEARAPPATATKEREPSDALARVCKLYDCEPALVNDLHHEACALARSGDMDMQFILFCVHNKNLYKQPTDTRDYTRCLEGLALHRSRPDYMFHGTTIKMPLTLHGNAVSVVTQVYSQETLLAMVASPQSNDYATVVSLV